MILFSDNIVYYFTFNIPNNRVYAEAGIPYRPYPMRDDLVPLFDKSPIACDLSKITTPTLFHIGI